MSNYPNKKIDELTFLMLEGDITPEQLAQLDYLLANDPDAPRQYSELVYVYSGLAQPGKADLLPKQTQFNNDNVFYNFINENYQPEPEEPETEQNKEIIIYPGRQAISASQILRVLGSIAAMIMVAFTLNHLSKMASTTQYDRIEPIVARITSTVDAKWLNNIDKSNLLRSGPIKLESGLAKIRFNNGAEVILEGPASAVLLSESEMELESGKITAYVSDNAVGFAVRTENTKIIDLGTSFAVAVENDNTDIYVFDGKVALLPGWPLTGPETQTDKIELQKGQAKRIDHQYQALELTQNDSKFITNNDFNIYHNAKNGTQYDKWLAHNHQMRRRGDVIVYYDFHHQTGEQLINKAYKTGFKADATLASYRTNGPLPEWTEGRWPEKAALQFDRRSRQYAYTDKNFDLCINGPITIAAWVKLQDTRDGGHILSNRLAHSKSNYQMAYNNSNYRNRIQFLRYDYGAEDENEEGDDERETIYSTKNEDLYLDQWVLIAATHDNNEVKFYRNGQLVSAHQYEYKQSQVLANLVIGSDSKALDYFMFNGIIDEIIILNNALSENEIQELYFNSKN